MTVSEVAVAAKPTFFFLSITDDRQTGNAK